MAARLLHKSGHALGLAGALALIALSVPAVGNVEPRAPATVVKAAAGISPDAENFLGVSEGIADSEVSQTDGAKGASSGAEAGDAAADVGATVDSSGEASAGASTANDSSGSSGGSALTRTRSPSTPAKCRTTAPSQGG